MQTQQQQEQGGSGGGGHGRFHNALINLSRARAALADEPCRVASRAQLTRLSGVKEMLADVRALQGE